MTSALTVAPQRRSRAALIAVGLCMLLIFCAFVALGSWQLQRLQWKRALIAQVEQRVHAAAVTAPGRSQWQQVNARDDAYRRVRLTGVFLYPLSARVQAVTEHGSGFWLMTPLHLADGSLVMVNRGFVLGGGAAQLQTERDRTDARVDEPVTVTGLLRMSEPGGGFLRSNDAAGERWYSRDVQAIAASRQLPPVAPYFVDADAAAWPARSDASADRPIGGLTVITFNNNHLVYALTWFALALMTAGAGFWCVRDALRRSRRGADHTDPESDDGRKSCRADGD